jgi:hypothetical protein
MKKVIYILFVFLTAALVYSCSEEQVGQTPTDSVAPGPVRNPVAVSLPGGVALTYDLPDDPDLLYVKAVYTINGKEKNTSATLFDKSLEIRGFGTTDPQIIKLYAVDRSENMSEPCSIEIVPDTPPIIPISESMILTETFGGVYLKWKNETQASVSIHILVQSEDGDWVEVDVAYSNLVDGNYSVRGMEAEERVFSVYVQDRWDNVSQSKTATLTPLFEEKLDKTLWVRKILPGDNSSDSSDFGRWDHINNDIWETDDIWETNPANKMDPILFTIDLGVTAKLSRYVLYQRINYAYRHFNPKYWTVWGTNELPTETNYQYWTSTSGGWKNDWVLLADCEAYKPSGMDNSTITPEDWDFAAQGHQFDMAEAPPVRYVRFHVTETWAGGLDFHISELTFYGKSKE